MANITHRYSVSMLGWTTNTIYTPKSTDKKIELYPVDLWNYEGDGTLYFDYDLTATSPKVNYTIDGATVSLSAAYEGTDSTGRHLYAATIPGSAITVDSFTVTVSGTVEGTAYETTAVTFTTVEPTTITCYTSSPKGSLESGDVMLNWYAVESGGATVSKYSVGYSSDGTTYTYVDTEASSLTVTSGTLTAGTVYWKVAAVNSSGVTCAYSSAASFTYIAPPQTPSVTVSGNARPTISWQTDSAQAFQVKIDDVLDTGATFGGDTSYRCGIFLQDGQHTAMVRVQNKYSIWSEWGSTLFTVSGAKLGKISLAAVSKGTDVKLTITGNSSCTGYIIYRDDIPVWTGTGTEWTDELAAGVCEYTAIGTTSTDSYYESDAVTVNAVPDCICIKLLQSGTWMKLDKSLSSVRSIATSTEVTGTYRHFYGAADPVLELTPYTDTTLQFDAGFATVEEAAAFRKLIGKVCVVKDTSGKRYIGAMLTATMTATQFNISFECSIKAAYYNEAVSI